jgi:beta-mannosidase
VDYFGRWKALHFAARRFFAPVAVAALRDEGSTRVRLINDGAALDARWRLRVVDVDGKVLRRREEAVSLAAAGVTSIGDFRDAELLAGADPKRTVAVFELLQNGAVSARQVVGFVEAKDQILPRQKLKASLSIDGDHYRLRLESAAYMRSAWIDFGALDVQVEDNLLDLLPGETRDIAVRGPVDLVTLREALKVKTLNDR